MNMVLYGEKSFKNFYAEWLSAFDIGDITSNFILYSSEHFPSSKVLEVEVRFVGVPVTAIDGIEFSDEQEYMMFLLKYS